MGIISLKSNARKQLTKQKGLYTSRDSLELFLECHFSLIVGYFSYIFLLLYGILTILFFKFKVNLIKPSVRQA